jgi:formate-dependent nitrite reductase cytochrome c552 subunit
VIAGISLFMIVFLMVISFLVEGGRAYLGLITYILLPAVMIFGLLLIPIGMLLKVRKEKRTGLSEVKQWPLVDLNNPRHRNAFFIFSGGTTVLLFMSAFGSYEAYNFTDSVTFCGAICHSVMHPEYTAYQNSPHARVACVGCHVGPGAGWYVRSKISGLYQVYAVVFNRYPKPIPTPIENLRPARETCEECHWPQKFYSQSVQFQTHYLPDKENTEWDIYLIMKIGAQHSALGLREGIHWHINPDVKIEYIADETRQKIQWVRYTNRRTGEARIFQDSENALSEDQVRGAQVRTMDCMDCHNRPSHDYRAPAIFVNNAITAGEIPRELPDVKSVAVDVCSKEYESTDAALKATDEAFQNYYRTKYPELYATNRALIDKAADGLKRAFSRSIFPGMKVRWSAYPNDIGHLQFRGCSRCHDNKHSGADGQAISRDCNLCHFIVAQGLPGKMEVGLVEQKLEFRHPEDIGDVWKEMMCTDCHTGANP